MEEVSEAELADVLGQSAFVMMGLLTKIAAEYEISLTQLRVLAILRDRQASMSGLAQHLGLDKSTLTGLVARAEKRGLLHRSPSLADRRAIDVSLSPAGLTLANAIASVFTASLHDSIDTLDRTEQQHLHALTSKVLDAAI